MSQDQLGRDIADCTHYYCDKGWHTSPLTAFILTLRPYLEEISPPAVVRPVVLAMRLESVCLWAACCLQPSVAPVGYGRLLNILILICPTMLPC